MLGEDHNVSTEHLPEAFQLDSLIQSDQRKVGDQGRLRVKGRCMLEDIHKKVDHIHICTF